MRIRPVQIWWLGVALFTPSVLIWIILVPLFVFKHMWNCPFDWFGIIYVYLPMFAAVIGFTIPLVCLRRFRGKSWRVTGLVFACYLAVMLAWGVIDVRHEHYQMGGHNYPNGPLVDGHRYYWHTYFTWYFMPYTWIEPRVAAYTALERER